MNRLRHLCVFALLFVLALSAVPSRADNVGANRDLMRRMAEGTMGVIEKNFYDSKFNGIDTRKLLEETKKKIDSVSNITEMNAAIFAMVEKMHDSHTNFVPPLLTLEPRFGFQAKPFGDVVRVYKVKKNSPAERAGLKPGDTILALDGVPANRETYIRTQMFYRLIEPAGVMLVDRERNGVRERVTIKADVITRPGVTMVYDFSQVFDMIREDEAYDRENPFQYGMVGNIGLVRIRAFDSHAAERVLWKIKGSPAVIVDLRGNPGGSVELLERVAGYFEKTPSLIAEAVGRNKTEKVMTKPQSPSFADLPVVVLVDSESASAAEAFARHIQLTKRGIVIGDRTAGALSGARFFRQQIGAENAVLFGVQTTVHKIVFPDGKSLEKVGVTPDQMCIPTAEDLARGNDPCLGMAAAMLKAVLEKKPLSPEDTPAKAVVKAAQ